MSDWDTTSVTNMSYMFSHAGSFNQPIGNWDVSNVTDMSHMFFNATSFNQPINNWDTSSVKYMTSMFKQAYMFNQPLGDWDILSVTDMSFMFEGVTLSTANYDNLLIGWSQLPLRNRVFFHGGNSKYSINAAYARTYVIRTFGWLIIDGGLRQDVIFSYEIPILIGISIIGALISIILIKKRYVNRQE